MSHRADAHGRRAVRDERWLHPAHVEVGDGLEDGWLYEMLHDRTKPLLQPRRQVALDRVWDDLLVGGVQPAMRRLVALHRALSKGGGDGTEDGSELGGCGACSKVETRVESLTIALARNLGGARFVNLVRQSHAALDHAERRASEQSPPSAKDLPSAARDCRENRL